MEVPLTGKNLAHRMMDIPWVLSHLRRVASESLLRVSPTEFAKLFRQVRPYTMCSSARLRGLYRAARHIVVNRIAGDVVECGVARGGSSAFMALALRDLGSDKTHWAFDTFEGIPAPTAQDPDYEIANLYTGAFRGDLEEIKHTFRKLGILERFRFVQGKFEDTLPVTQLGPIALLHIDGDWYSSVKACLDNLYDRVSPGGVIQLDDYGFWQGAEKATDEFLSKRNLPHELIKLDYSGRQIWKGAAMGAGS
jgi:predicted O-methyltransferase YrrM